MNKKINILYAVSSNYLVPLCVSLVSLFENNRKEKINVYIFYSDLKQHEIETIKKISDQYEQNLITIEIRRDYFSSAPSGRWTKEAYYRLLIGELLPQDIERVLYIDCDTVISGSIKNIFEINMQGKALMALPEYNNSKEARDRLGMDESGKYYQTGVILFEFSKIQELLTYSKVNEVIAKLGNRLTVVDQDIINVMFNGDIADLDEIYNDCLVTNYENKTWKRITNHINLERLNRAVILHYAASKPWNNIFAGSCEDIWYKYLRLSPFSHIYIRKYGRIHYKVLRIGLVKSILSTYVHVAPFLDKMAKTIMPNKLYTAAKTVYRKRIK